MERWDLYNEDRQLVGKTIERGQNCPQDLYRMVIHICIFNKKGQMLIQQRQSTKKSWPNAWDITLGGCVQAGENSRQAAKRELSEELGLDYDFSNVRPYMTINFDNGFDDFYLIEKDVSLNEVTFKDLTFIVKEIDGARITKLKILRKPHEEDVSADEEC